MLGIIGLVILILGILIFYSGYRAHNKKKVYLGLVVFVLSLVYVIPEFAGDFFTAIIKNNN